MKLQFKAEKRAEQGTGASRRLRREGRLPGIIYGGGEEALPITMDHNELYHLMRKEVFHSSVLTVELGGKKENVILRDAQWHPYKPQVLHIDFLRINPKEKLHIKVPLHFINGDACPAVKAIGGIISHVINEVEVTCLPKDLPEYIEVDLGKLEAGHTALHLSSLQLPKGVEVVHHGGETDPLVVSIFKRGGGSEGAAEGAADGDAAA